MQKDFFSNQVMIGNQEVAFEKREIQNQFYMYLPSGFSEDKNLVSKYTYLFSRDKSPLSIAIRFAPAFIEERDRMISHYFAQDEPGEIIQPAPAITYRETLTRGNLLSIYSLRFSVELPEGILFGCFNSSKEDAADWKPVVLEMLKQIEPK